MKNREDKMANEVVKYHNDLNTVNLRKWSAEEMNFFFSIIAKVRDEGKRLIIFDTDELRELAGDDKKNLDRWNQTMESVAVKVLDLKYFERTSSTFMAMNLFSYFRVDANARTVEVEVSSKFEYVTNKLEAQFTRYELEEFTSIRSTYAKTMYRLLKQWRLKGEREFQTDELRTLLQVPETYTGGEVTRRVVKPIEKELSKLFRGFKCKVIKSNKKGNPVIGYKFTWEAEKSEGYIPDKFSKQHQQQRSNVPEWHDASYQNPTTDFDKEEMERKKRELLARLDDRQTRR